MKRAGSVKSYKDLITYQKAYGLCLDVYALTKGFPSDERYGLVSQMRRAAVSIPSNIAEGYRRKNRKEYTQFLRIALGSLAELETQLSLSKDLSYTPDGTWRKMSEQVEEVARLLYKLIEALEK